MKNKKKINSDAYLKENIAKDVKKKNEKAKENAKDILQALNVSKENKKAIVKIAIITIMLLLITLFANYVYQNVIKPSANSAITEITDWNFVWGSSDGAISDEISVWKKATASNKVSKLSFSNKYIRLNTTLSPNTQNTIIRYYTPYCPSKVEVNSMEVYNNGYGEKSLVGNAYNAFEIQSSTSQQVVDIYIYSPLFFNFEAYDISTLKMDNFTVSSLGLFLSIAVLLASVILIALTAAVVKRNKNIAKLCALSITLFFVGASLLLNQISMNTSQLNESIFFNLQLVFEILFTAMVIFDAYLCCNYKSKFNQVTIIMGLVIFLVATLAIPNPLFLAIVAIAYALILLIATVYLLFAFSDSIVAKKSMSKPATVLFLYITIINIYDLVTMALSAGSTFRNISTVGSFIYVVAMFSVLFKISVNQSIVLQERKNQIEENSEWFAKTTKNLSNMILTDNDKDFAIRCNDIVVDIIRRNQAQLKSLISQAEMDANIDIHSCIAVYENGAYKEVYNSGEIENCDYKGLSELAKAKEFDKVRFAQTYLDIVFEKDSDVSIIMHFENFNNGLSDISKKNVLTVYSNMQMVYQNIYLKSDIDEVQQSSIIALAETVEFRSHGTEVHLFAVSAITKIICEKLKLTSREIEIVSAAAKVHDIGKIAISDEIINKNGPLTPEQFATIKNHVLYGYNILMKSPGEFMNAAAIIAYQHHENFDGTGYLGLKGDEIHLYARIVHLADVIDALASKRAYKESWSAEKVKQYVIDSSGTSFDPEVVDVAVGCFDEILNETKRVHTEFGE